jgi:hypothetical protein
MTARQKQKDNTKRAERRKVARDIERMESIGRWRKRCGTTEDVTTASNESLLSDLKKLKRGDKE